MTKEQEIVADFLLFYYIRRFFLSKGLLNKNIHAKIIYVKLLTKGRRYGPHH